MKLILLALVMIVGVAGQTQTRTSPDCGPFAFTFTSVGSSADLNNVPQIASGVSVGGCDVWMVQADAFNGGAGTLVFQSASTSTVTGNGPGAYATFAGTTVAGTNPISVFPWTFQATGYYPWTRVTATALSAGTIRGTIQGWRNPGGGSGGGGGGGSTVVTNFTACQSGTNTIKSQPISITTSGLTQIVAASGSTVITICSLSVLANASTNITIDYGTGASCGTGTTAVSGAYQSAFGIALDSLNLALPASQALCLNSSAVVTAGGLVTYVQQ
jgi:hypothetical protein